MSTSSRESTSGTADTSDRESSGSPSKPAATRTPDSDDDQSAGPDDDEPDTEVGGEVEAPAEESTEPPGGSTTSPEPPLDIVNGDAAGDDDPEPAAAESPASPTPPKDSGSTPEPSPSTTVADQPPSVSEPPSASQPPSTHVPVAERTSPATAVPVPSTGALAQPVSLVGALVSTVLAPLSDGAPAAPAQRPLLWVVLAWVRRELQRTFANSTPTTSPQSVTLTLDSETAIGRPVAFDAEDADDDPLVYTVPPRGAVGGPTHGTVTVDQATGTFTYDPDDAYALIGGTDTFTYTVSDAAARRTFFGIPLSRSATSATGTVTVTLNPVHVAPGINGDTATTVEDRPVTIAVLDNDTDANGDALTVSGVTQGSSGTVTFTASGVTYTPNADFTGTDTFTYTATDGRSAGTATVTVTVTPVDDAPVAVGDSVTVAEDSDTTVIDVLANDIDVDGGPKVVTGVTPPAHGTVTAIGPSLSYTPAADFHGTDAFTYTLSDGSTAIVNVIVTPVDDAPVAVGDAVTVAEDSGPTVIDILANDTDIDAGPKTITAFTQPAEGSVTVTGTTVTYTPTADFHGTDTFTYTLNGEATATVTVTVTPVDDAPVAVGDTATVDEDSGPAVIDVLANDTDIDAGPKTITAVTQPARGTVTVTASGLTYTPTADFHGTDSFTYTLNGGATATVTVTVTPVDDAPVAVGDTATVAEGGTITIAVIGNDTDADGDIDTTTVVIVRQPTAGTATVNGDGTVTYVSDGSEVTSDSFTYTVKDITGVTSNAATVSITVNPVNDAPVAVNDTYTVAEDGVLVISTPGVLANDSDPENDSFTIASATQPQHGAVNYLFSHGAFKYTPAAGFSGTDTFTYTLNGGATATVTVTVTPVDDAPVAVNDAVTVGEDSGPTVIDVLANDTDIDAGPKTITAVTQPARGTVTFTASGLTYTPTADFHGTDSFTYTLNGGATATVTVTVTPVDDAPVAVGDTATVDEGGTITISVIGNDTDADGDIDTTTVVIVRQPTAGTATVNGDGTVTYVSDGSEVTSDSFTYTVKDTAGVTSNVATVSITVNPVNDAPVAVNDAYTVAENGLLVVGARGVLGNDIDAEHPFIYITTINNPRHGTFDEILSDGSFTYRPHAGYFGTDSFTYQINDVAGLTSNTATVTITITPVDDAPVAVNDTVTVAEGGTTTLAVIANDTDADGDIDTATVVIVRQPSAGTATVNSDGTVTYASDGSEITTDSFEYTVKDAAGAISNAATVIITVTTVDDAPVAVNDTVTIAEDTLATFIDVLANDTDIDGGPKTITSITSPAGGHALVIGNRVRYFSAPNFHGTETFTYTLNGGATATVTVIVTPISEAPVIHRVTSTPGVGNTWVLAVDASDDDGGALTTTVTSANATVPLTFTRLPGGAIQVDVDPTWARAHPGAQLPVTVTVTDAENISATKQLTVGTVSNAVSLGHNIYGQRNIPALPPGVTYTQVATTSLSHTVLLRSDGTAVAVGDYARGQLNIPPLPTGMTYTQVANGSEHTVLLRSDGTAIAVGGNSDGQLNIPRLPAGVTYTRIAAGNYGTVLLRSDGTAVGVGNNTYGQLNIPQPPPGVTYTQAAVGLTHTVLLRSDGTAVALGDNAFGKVVVPALPTGLKYTQTAAGDLHSVLLRSDGTAVAFGNNQWGQSTVPALPAGLRYTQVAAGRYNSMLLRSDGTAIGFGQNASSQLSIPVLPAGLVYTYAAASNHTVLLFNTSSSFNSPPLATNDAATVAEGGTITFSVTANDTDTDGTLNTATVVITRQPTAGSVTVNTGGTVTYVSNGAEVSADSFAYRVNDNKGATSNEATVSITITPVNDAPVAVDDAYTVAKNGVLVISAPGLLANDSDPEGNSFTIVAATGTQHGTVDPLYSNGSFTYRPAAGYSGTDTFTYTISDGTSTAEATVIITVSAVDNQAPVAVADSYTVAEDGTLNVTGPGVLANDTDADGDPLSVVAAGPTSHGTFTLRSDGSFTYTPVANFHGTDSFTYQVSDGSGPSMPATVTITVTPVNDAPVVQNDTIPFPKDGFIGFSLANRSSDVDGDTLTATLISGTTHGTLFFDGTNRAFSYRPNTGFTGQDSFTYKVNDGKLDSAIATVILNVS